MRTPPARRPARRFLLAVVALVAIQDARLERELFERDFERSTEIREPRSIGWSAYISSFIANQLGGHDACSFEHATRCP